MTLFSDHPDLATCFDNRACVLSICFSAIFLGTFLSRCFVAFQDKLDEASALFLRAIDITEKHEGPEHQDVALWLDNCALLLRKQVRAFSTFQGYFSEICR